MLSNPVVQRELVSLLRSRKMLAIQILMAAGLALLLVLRWPTDNRVALSGTRSQEVFRLFSTGLLCTVLLLLPVFPATSIVREKITGTLALLLNTPLGAWRIYLGKLAAVLGVGGLILVLSLPAASACFALGGLTWNKDFVRLYLVLALTTFQYAALGLLISSFMNSIDAAVRWTYGAMLLLSVVSIGPHYFFQGTETLTATVGDWLRCISPFAALAAVLGAADVGAKGLMTTTDVPGLYMVWSVAVGLVASAWTVGRLNHAIFDQARSAGVISNDLALGARILRRLVFIVDPQRRSWGIPPLVNPVMVKEFRCRRFGRLHWLLRLVAICAVLSLLLTYAATQSTVSWSVEEIGGIMVILQTALFVLITPSIASGLISAERESGGWQLLQMTPLSVARIVWGKLLSVILTMLLVFCATLPGYFVMAWIKPELMREVQRVVVCLAASAGFAMMASAGIGCLFRRTTLSTSVSYGVLLLISAVPLLIWMGRDAPFGHATVERALLVNPIAAALSVIQMEGFQTYDLIPGNWYFLGIASAAALVVLVVQTYRVSRPQ